MLLESLLQVIETLQKRIESHGSELRQSEALTRYTLVNPLLRALEWDTEDPTLVMPEFKLGNGLADYALLSGGKPAIVIEAKKLGTPLGDAAAQGINYCVSDGIGYFVATDGRQWDVYETHKKVPIAEKLIVRFNLADSPASVCLDALALWRRSVQNGAVRKAQTPLIEQDAPDATASGQPAPAPAMPATAPPAPPVSNPSVEGNWIPLSQLQAATGDTPPPEIRFPDGSTAPVKYWVDIPYQTACWLDQNRKLDETRIPLQHGKRFILSGSPVHSTGKEFGQPKTVGRFYLEGNHNGRSHIRNANTIIAQAGKEVAAEQFSVRMP